MTKFSNFQYGQVPYVRKSRSRFNMSKRLFTSMNVGELVPVYIQEVLPGDTFKVKDTSVIRTSSPYLKPVMDNLFMDTYYFYVPNRLCYDKWVNVMGENTESAWANTQEYSVPTLPAGSVTSGSIADYFGLPVGDVPAGVSILPFRAYALIYNEWFRDQNNIDPVYVNTGAIGEAEVFNANVFAPNNYLGMPAKVGKLHDYFTSALPSPQKAIDPVELRLNFADVPVVSGFIDNTALSDVPVQWKARYGGENVDVVPSGPVYHDHLSSENFVDYTDLADDKEFEDVSGGLIPINLRALASNVPSGISVNDFRYALALQRMLERDARYGSRYYEYLQGAFGVTSPDARLQRPEFLGGKRNPLNVQQVAQTSESTEGGAIGSLGAFSLSNGSSRFTKSFVEHGFVIGLACIRQFHTYSQGVEKFWTRTERTDFYDPEFANIGEVPIYQSELFVKQGDTLNSTVFGYQEAWADYRTAQSRITGQMRTGVENSLDLYHFGDNYANAPSLNEQFINETGIYVDRTLAVSSEYLNPFIINMYFEAVAYRTLPTYSIPSLTGHK